MEPDILTAHTAREGARGQVVEECDECWEEENEVDLCRGVEGGGCQAQKSQGCGEGQDSCTIVSLKQICIRRLSPIVYKKKNKQAGAELGQAHLTH